MSPQQGGYIVSPQPGGLHSVTSTRGVTQYQLNLGGYTVSTQRGGLHSVNSTRGVIQCLLKKRGYTVSPQQGGGGYTVSTYRRFTKCHFNKGVTQCHLNKGGGGLHSVNLQEVYKVSLQ